MGTIDALEWVGPSMDISMGFHKIAPFIIQVGMNQHLKCNLS